MGIHIEEITVQQVRTLDAEFFGQLSANSLVDSMVDFHAANAPVQTTAQIGDLFTCSTKKDAPTDDELLAMMLGPTGNLRAPTIRHGATLLVGFDEDVYMETL